jgi:LuxR family maltose regulon positive regulatory protein
MVTGSGMSRHRSVRMRKVPAPGPQPDPVTVPPPVPGGLVRRPRLHRVLDEGLAAPVTLLSAAAGWGKTVLADAWADDSGATGRVVARVHLDEDRNAPQPFWRAVAGALLHVVDGPGAEHLRRVVAGGMPTEYLPGAVADALRRPPAPVVLVLDDLHEITSLEVHEGILRLVGRPLPTVSILVCTRRDPPWPLQRLRVAGLVHDVRAADLAFRPEEATELFTRLRVTLTPSQVGRLVDRTEGWAAGLRLAALHLDGRPDLDAAVAAFSGDDHSVAGYLLTEVLDHQTPELMAFLAEVSVVDLVCADLASALTGRADAGRVLADLAGSHLFVQAVDRPGRWFRLHRLILDILRARTLPSRERRDLHRRAAEWFRGRGMPLEAIRSAVAGNLWRLAADLTGVHAVELVMSGRAAVLERLLAQVPRTVLTDHAELAAGLAGARVAQGSALDVAGLLDDARAARGGLPARRSGRATVLLDLSAGGLSRLIGDWAAVQASYRRVPLESRALADLGMAGAEIVPVVARNNLGTAALWTGDLDAAERHLTAAAEADVPGIVLARLNAGAYHALLRAERGEPGPAEAEAQKVLAAAAAGGLEDTVQVAAAHLALVRVALDRDAPGDADERLARLADLDNVGSEPHVRLLTALLEAERRAAAGHPEAALALLRAQLAADGARAPRVLRERSVLTEVALLARTGAPEHALQVLRASGHAETPSGRVAEARLRLVLGDLRGAETLRRPSGSADTVRSRVEILVLDALLAAAGGAADVARERCEEAVAAALPWGLRSPFLSDAVATRPLLQACVEAGTSAPEFVLDLLGRMDAGPDEQGEARRPLADPPTERERTVLRYLSSSLSNAEIAAELYVSISTVKTHERALYRKLGAAGRRDAVRRARLLGLL